MHESPPPAQPEAEAEDDLPAFAPVPLARARRDGWTPEKQRGFIAALAQTGVVAKAARAVGMGVTSAYALRARPGGEGFARAWDRVQDEARERAFALVSDLVIHGVTRPRFYRGRFVGTATRFETRLALAALRAIEPRPPRPAAGGKAKE